jgi:hypothetical protein
LLGSACENEVTAVTPTFGAHVDDPVGDLDDVVVMLDNDDGMATGNKAGKRLNEFLYVMEMETRGGLVEDKELRPLCGALD